MRNRLLDYPHFSGNTDADWNLFPVNSVLKFENTRNVDGVGQWGKSRAVALLIWVEIRGLSFCGIIGWPGG